MTAGNCTECSSSNVKGNSYEVGCTWICVSDTQYVSQQYKKCTPSAAKGKAIPLQAWRGPEVSRRFRLSDFKTIAT